ncbi:hypothetical protein C4G49_RS23225 [Vibrio parahaemolyticus]|nr:hypothetical protein [Vibrio parahaemolyticus]
MKRPLDQVRIRGAGYKPVLDDVPQYTPSIERVKDTPAPEPTHECKVKILCTLDELNQLQVGVWALAKTSKEPKISNWKKSNTSDNATLLSAKCLNGEEKHLQHDVFADAGHIVQDTIIPKPIGSLHIHAEYVPAKLMVQTSENGLAWAAHGYYYHFINSVLSKEYKVVGGERWSYNLTRSKAFFLSDELLSEHHYTSILLPYKLEEKPVPLQHILFKSEKLTSDELANINHAWLEDHAVALDLDEIVAIRQKELLERPQQIDSATLTLEESTPVHTVKTNADTGQNESWTEIAALYGLAPKALLNLNPLYEHDPLSLKAGDILQVKEWKAPEQCLVEDQAHPIKTIGKVHPLGDIWGKYQKPTINDKLVNISEDKNLSANVPVINATHMFWPAYNFLAEEGKKELNVIYEKPIKDYAWLSVEEAKEFAENLYDDLGGKNTLGDIKDYGLGLGKGSYDAYTIAQGLGGLKVQSYTKRINGQDWIIIKNYRKHLKTLERGHMWQATNPRIIQLGLGLNDLKGAARFVRFNVGLEIAVSVGINAVDFALRDEATVAEFVGNSAGDIVKGLVALGTAVLLTTTFVPATASVLLTGSVFVIMSFIAGKGLDQLDKSNGYSNKITKAIEEYYNDNN